MLFNSLAFVFFFIIVTGLYFLLPHKHRWKLVLAASCYFYMAFVPVYILILGFTIIVDYYAGIYIEKSEGRRRRLFLVCSLIANIGVLAVFKYFNFLNENFTVLLSSFSLNNPVPFLKILLPIGLSFHTFQAMSYTIEVYRGNQKAERNFGIYALYVMYYPQLVAGPIERPQNILHQFYEKHDFDTNRVTAGLRQMLWGFFKKIVVADRLALYVDAVYNNPHQHSGISIIVATIFFSFQIYCDFSAYSDIALGCAKVMGITLMRNFKRPYFAKNIQEFWSRWHISLSTWFRDYLYIPLGGNRVSKIKWYRNIFIVFLISGLWHGANWTYIIWGGLHGVYQIVESVGRSHLKPIKNDTVRRISNFFKIIANFFLVAVAWVFFRANTVNDAFYMIKSMFILKPGHLFLGRPPTIFGYAFFAIILLLALEIPQEYFPNLQVLNNGRRAIRYAGYFFLIICILLIGVLNGGQFIYFQF